MNQNDNIEALFKRLEGEFDTKNSPQGHNARFMQRLNKEQPMSSGKPKIAYWKIVSAFAAVITLAFLLTGVFSPAAQETSGLASVSPEMAQTQEFFNTAINTELERLNSFESQAAKQLVNDAMLQMENLEQEYLKLVVDLEESGNDKRVIHAMIKNFQSRIDLLQHVISTIEGIELINQSNTDESII
ncbi:hypothetical protein [Gilvibacter sp.]|uniref:hypothetical protein n=1 Tax=Gilvibacter sp. TaxID=2729997 RepID=UPI0025BBD9D5|nr:hypothetical protein [Gilvibacter sp.]NQX78401.1 hypothetical protein [Gilvibacter sp.]